MLHNFTLPQLPRVFANRSAALPLFLRISAWLPDVCTLLRAVRAFCVPQAGPQASLPGRIFTADFTVDFTADFTVDFTADFTAGVPFPAWRILKTDSRRHSENQPKQRYPDKKGLEQNREMRQFRRTLLLLSDFRVSKVLAIEEQRRDSCQGCFLGMRRQGSGWGQKSVRQLALCFYR